jgi:hypothetical protein
MNTGNIWVRSGSPVRGSPGSPWYAAPGTPLAGQYAGYYAERQSRFYFRSLRRSGVYFVDVPTVLLWAGDGCADDNDLWP